MKTVKLPERKKWWNDDTQRKHTKFIVVAPTLHERERHSKKESKKKPNDDENTTPDRKCVHIRAFRHLLTLEHCDGILTFKCIHRSLCIKWMITMQHTPNWWRQKKIAYGIKVKWCKKIFHYMKRNWFFCFAGCIYRHFIYSIFKKFSTSLQTTFGFEVTNQLIGK